MKKRFRIAIQSIAALLQNANFKGFFTGKIYQGNIKNVCVPGLNCYSCPGATGSCPIGALQNAVSSYRFKFPYYVLGLLIFFGALLGRFVCGFLCPFGFLQDLINLLPIPVKIKTFKGDMLLRKLKYLILIVMVLILPVCIKLTPFFCKYLCPSGTLAGLLLMLSDTSLFKVLGGRFMWKLSILAIILVLSAVIYRPFCKYLCPLGAFYGPFNKISLFTLKIDESKCTGCGHCHDVCKMQVNPCTSPDHTECIRCGECINECPAKAICYSCKVK